MKQDSKHRIAIPAHLYHEDAFAYEQTKEAYLVRANDVMKVAGGIVVLTRSQMLQIAVLAESKDDVQHEKYSLMYEKVARHLCVPIESLRRITLTKIGQLHLDRPFQLDDELVVSKCPLPDLGDVLWIYVDQLDNRSMSLPTPLPPAMKNPLLPGKGGKKKRFVPEGQDAFDFYKEPLAA